MAAEGVGTGTGGSGMALQCLGMLEMLGTGGGAGSEAGAARQRVEELLAGPHERGHGLWSCPTHPLCSPGCQVRRVGGGGAGNWGLATRVALGWGWYQLPASTAVVGRHAGGDGSRGCGGSRRQSCGMRVCARCMGAVGAWLWAENFAHVCE